jgi:hypothetical protein
VLALSASTTPDLALLLYADPDDARFNADGGQDR